MCSWSPVAICGFQPIKLAGRHSKKWNRLSSRAVADFGYELVRAHLYKPDQQHGFIGSQKEGLQVFAGIDPKAPLIVAEAVWQYSHHVLHGLITHRADPDRRQLVGHVAGSGGHAEPQRLAHQGGREVLDDLERRFHATTFFKTYLRRVAGRQAKLSTQPTTSKPLARTSNLIARPRAEAGGAACGETANEKSDHGRLRRRVHGNVQRDHSRSTCSTPPASYKERLSQSALYYETTQVSDDEARRGRRLDGRARHEVHHRPERSRTI